MIVKNIKFNENHKKLRNLWYFNIFFIFVSLYALSIY